MADIPAKINNALPGRIGMGKMVLIALSKSATERALSTVPMVGNGTLKSAIVKGVGSAVLYGATKNQRGIVGDAGEIVSTGLMVDAADDIANVIMQAVARKWGNSASVEASAPRGI